MITENREDFPDRGEMEMDRDSLKLLSEITFSATMLDLIDDPEPVFNLIAQKLPNNAAGYIGKALAKLKEQKPEEARALMEEKALKAEVNIENAKGVYLFILQTAGETDLALELAKQYLKEEKPGTPSYKMAEALIKDAGLEDQVMFDANAVAAPKRESSQRTGPYVPGLA
ncbi:hypothetical protein [Aestuariispira insulae]|uniref:Tetratricopeptide repeat protein n=1 Tax=Aestuariispira insulae TaxID=1461337 RepID=A0A3D9H2G8_9PROT|nr:hypothetical protein [Aestuariispira insulae]RED43698.1 hypothetical protein DFP90_1219 [Aestuariispira insulae]